MYMKAYDLSEGGCMSFYASKNGRQNEKNHLNINNYSHAFIHGCLRRGKHK